MKLVSIAIPIVRLHRCRELYGSFALDRRFYPNAGDPQIENKRRQAREVGGELKVVSFTKTSSTSKLAKIL
jgi:hypothetical protein